MFICYKCGYKDLSDGNNERYCPICGTDNTIPKCSFILFLLLVSFIIVTFASFNNDDLHSIILMLLVLIGIFIPLALIESEKEVATIQKELLEKWGYYDENKNVDEILAFIQQ